MKKKKRERGFTLVEVLIVVIIIGFLASVVGPELISRISQATQNTAANQIHNFSVALNNYRFDNGHYPTTEQGLEALIQKPTTSPVPENWNGPYLQKNSIPDDPWGNEYHYRSPGINNPHSFDLWSYGANNQEGGTGEDADVTNW